MNNAALQVFVTGGTFDKEYNYITGQLTFSETHLHQMIKLGRCSLEVNISTLMMKDSLDMVDEDRKMISEACKKSASSQIVITHGTDTMVETATFLANAGIDNKTIVLTGALVPYTFGTSSDGFFNLGAALAFAQVIPPGIYIAMNGRFFPWNSVRKNYNTGFFEEMNSMQSIG
jgi:L-asparaginase